MLTPLFWSMQPPVPPKMPGPGAEIRQQISGGLMRKVVLLFIAASLHLATTAHVFGAELEEAISLLKQMHADQCQQQKLRGQLMLAHRNHDQETLNALWPQIEAISKRLKPSEEKLKVLKVSIGNNPADQSAFETALLREADCG